MQWNESEISTNENEIENLHGTNVNVMSLLWTIDFLIEFNAIKFFNFFLNLDSELNVRELTNITE